MERCRKGDDPAWEELVNRYQSRVYALAYRFFGDPEEARDVTQEAFIRIYRRLETFSGGDFVPWMLRLARNLCVDRLRRQKARPGPDFPVEAAPEIPDPGPTPEASWVTNERKRLVYRALKTMSGELREMIVLKEIRGLSLREIAAHYGIPVGTVKSRSNRARIELARTVLELDPSYGS
ncbi:MAG: sigma-70 family RNA polymerase sigma factor [bacterium]|nr:sigma-70 family RNA polymerase sigma factor [bacterium]